MFFLHLNYLLCAITSLGCIEKGNTQTRSFSKLETQMTWEREADFLSGTDSRFRLQKKKSLPKRKTGRERERMKSSEKQPDTGANNESKFFIRKKVSWNNYCTLGNNYMVLIVKQGYKGLVAVLVIYFFGTCFLLKLPILYSIWKLQGKDMQMLSCLRGNVCVQFVEITNHFGLCMQGAWVLK